MYQYVGNIITCTLPDTSINFTTLVSAEITSIIICMKKLLHEDDDDYWDNDNEINET